MPALVLQATSKSETVPLMDFSMWHPNSFDMVGPLDFKTVVIGPVPLGDSGRLERGNSTAIASCQSLPVRFSSFEFCLGSFS